MGNHCPLFVRTEEEKDDDEKKVLPEERSLSPPAEPNPVDLVSVSESQGEIVDLTNWTAPPPLPPPPSSSSSHERKAAEMKYCYPVEVKEEAVARRKALDINLKKTENEEERVNRGMYAITFYVLAAVRNIQHTRSVLVVSPLITKELIKRAQDDKEAYNLLPLEPDGTPRSFYREAELELWPVAVKSEWFLFVIDHTERTVTCIDPTGRTRDDDTETMKNIKSAVRRAASRSLPVYHRKRRPIWMWKPRPLIDDTWLCITVGSLILYGISTGISLDNDLFYFECAEGLGLNGNTIVKGYKKFAKERLKTSFAPWIQ